MLLTKKVCLLPEDLKSMIKLAGRLGQTESLIEGWLDKGFTELKLQSGLGLIFQMYESGLEKEGTIDLKARYSNLSSVRASAVKGKLESLGNKNSPKRRSNSRSKEQTR